MRERAVVELSAEEVKKQKIRETQAKPGTMGLSDLLDRRRVEHAIPDGAFKCQPVWDRVLIWQVSEWEGETWGDTRILMPEITQSKQRESAPRGVVVGIGMSGKDAMYAHGIREGHIVRFLQLAPWRMRCAIINGKEEYLLVVRAGDIVASEDLRSELLERPNAVLLNPQTKQHTYRDTNGIEWTPSMADMPADY